MDDTENRKCHFRQGSTRSSTIPGLSAKTWLISRSRAILASWRTGSISGENTASFQFLHRVGTSRNCRVHRETHRPDFEIETLVRTAGTDDTPGRSRSPQPPQEEPRRRPDHQEGYFLVTKAMREALEANYGEFWQEKFADWSGIMKLPGWPKILPARPIAPDGKGMARNPEASHAPS